MHCAVVGCTTDNQSKTYKNEFFFQFPKDVNMCKAWKYACGRFDDFSTNTARICELHFDKTDYEKEFKFHGSGYKLFCRLKSYALPTLNLFKESYMEQNVSHKDRIENTGATCPNEAKNINPVSESRPKRKCAVSSCKAQANRILDFPNPKIHKKTYLQWISLCKNEELKKISPEEISKLYGICDAHFVKETRIIHDSLPTLELPEKAEPSTKQKIYKPSQLCRLCLNIGSVNTLSCKYYKKALRDIIKLFVPIEIKKDDFSTSVCQSCKCEVIRYYNFLLKSLEVDEYYQALSREIGDDKDSVVLVQPDISSNKVEGNQLKEAHLNSRTPQAVIVESSDDDNIIDDDEDDNIEDADDNIIDDDEGDNIIDDGEDDNIIDDEEDDIIEDEEGDIIEDEEGDIIEDVEDANSMDVKEDDIIANVEEKNIKNGTKTLGNELVKLPLKKTITEIENVAKTIVVSDEEDTESKVPSYVMNLFHTYVKSTSKKNKVKINNKENATTNLVKLPIAYPEDAFEVEILEHNEDDTDTIICIHCNKVIDNIDDFAEHCRLENHVPLFACPVCNKICNNQIELNEHCQIHKRSETYICDRCGKQFAKRDSLNSHLNFVHAKNNLQYECNSCSKKFATNYRLKLHMRVHSNDRPYCCEKCGAVFTMLAYLRNHQTIHSDYRPHKCLICNKGFRRRHKLAIHLTMHTGEAKYTCEKCGISYKRKVNLTRHNRKHHLNSKEDTEEQPRNCTQCDFVCNFAAQLKIHMLKVHKSYTCTICDMTFTNYQPYYNHKFKHYPHKKNFVCEYCNKRFMNASLLNVHLVVHTGKKNFKCEVCEKRFSQRPHLQSHLLTHTGEKPHKCRYCGNSFAHLSTLVVHERTHTGETPYVCQFCSKGFGHLTNYKKHVFTKHGVVMPKTRDYSKLKRVSEDNEDNEVKNDSHEEVAIAQAESEEYILINAKNNSHDEATIVNEESEEYILINEELLKGEVCEIISDSNSMLEVAEEV